MSNQIGICVLVPEKYLPTEDQLYNDCALLYDKDLCIVAYSLEVVQKHCLENPGYWFKVGKRERGSKN